MSRNFFVYILTNASNKVLYTGVTNNLLRRMDEHKNATNKNSFTGKYKVNKLLYYECGDSAEGAIMREKQIKGGSRQSKIDLIENINPGWKDLYEQL